MVTTATSPTVASTPPVDETLTITANIDGFVHVYQFHVYGNVSIKDEVEVSRMANRGGGSVEFNHGRMPTVVTGTIECRGGLAVPDMRRHTSQVDGTQYIYYTQKITADLQLSILDSLVGKIVTIDCRGAPVGGVRGLFREGTKRPDLDHDEGVYFDFQMYQDPPLSSTTGLDPFGNISIEFVPAKSDMPGAGEESCKTVTKKSYDVTVKGTLAALGANPALGLYFFATSKDPGVEQSRRDLKDPLVDAGHAIKTTGIVTGAILKSGLGKVGNFISRKSMKNLSDQGLIKKREKTATVCS